MACCTVCAHKNYSSFAYYPNSYTIRRQSTAENTHQVETARTPYAPTPTDNYSASSTAGRNPSIHTSSSGRCLSSIQNHHYPRHPWIVKFRYHQQSTGFPLCRINAKLCECREEDFSSYKSVIQLKFMYYKTSEFNFPLIVVVFNEMS